MESPHGGETGDVLRRLPVDLFQLGLDIQQDEFLREALEHIPLFDMETGKIVTLWKDSEATDWISEAGWRTQDEWEKQRQIRQSIGNRYVEIPYISHAEAHGLLEEFRDSLDDEAAKEAAAKVKGIGAKLLELEQYGIQKWQWDNYMQAHAQELARDWLHTLGIEPI